MKIAIIGSGISGLICAYYLSKHHEVTIFEKNDYLGGHTRTLEYIENGKVINIDTGFIVFNHETYPLFSQIIKKEKIHTQKSEMSFSFKDEASGFEYNGHSMMSLFAQKSNMINVKFYQMLYDIIRFNRLAKHALDRKENLNIDLSEYLDSNKFGKLFKDAYLYPMAQAIWSSSLENVHAYSTYFILSFFKNHGLLNYINRPTWYTISNGSKQYIPVFIKNCENNILLNQKVNRIERNKETVVIKTDSAAFNFDKVIVATHSDQALKLLASPSTEETKLLGNIQYQPNEICLHTDSAIMPVNQKCWASWNFRRNKENTCQLTYYMNRLQNLNCQKELFVSVNQTNEIHPEKILDVYSMSHPILDSQAYRAQKDLNQLNNQHHTLFCGAYWKNGFHEDGVASAMNVCRTLGVPL